jgi:hypothetical protein
MLTEAVVAEAVFWLVLHELGEGGDVGMLQDRQEIRRLKLRGKERRRIRGRGPTIIEETKEQKRWLGEDSLAEMLKRKYSDRS